jgi:dephospho-CoA kinase
MMSYVTGAIGSGKTYAATHLAERLEYPVVSLDSIFFDLQSSTHRKRKDEETRQHELRQSLSVDNVVLEG